MGRPKKNDMEETAAQVEEQETEDTAPETETELQETAPSSEEHEGEQELTPDEKLSAEMQVLKEQNEALVKQMEEMKKQLSAAGTPVVVQTPDTERVHFLWQAEVAPDNIKTFGPSGMYGRIVGKQGSFYVLKSDLSRIMDEENRFFLDKRWLIVVSGLNDEEREALGVNYKEGELLDKNAFGRMVELGDELLEIYPELCEGHKVMVAQRYREAFAAGSAFVTRERVSKLAEMSREAGMGPNPFAKILQMMNEREAENA